MTDRLLSVISAVFLLIFTGAAAVLHMAPQQVEQHARPYVVGAVKKGLEQKHPKIAAHLNKYGAIAKQARDAAQQKGDGLGHMIAQKINARIDALCTYKCGSDHKVGEIATKSIGARFKKKLLAYYERAHAWLKSEYDERVSHIVRELFVFSVINAFVFLLIFIGSANRAPKTRAFRISLWLLFASTAVAMWTYVFGQNWFYTVLHSSYVGMFYLVWIGLLFAIAADCAFNKGRILANIALFGRGH